MKLKKVERTNLGVGVNPKEKRYDATISKKSLLNDSEKMRYSIKIAKRMYDLGLIDIDDKDIALLKVFNSGLSLCDVFALDDKDFILSAKQILDDCEAYEDVETIGWWERAEEWVLEHSALIGNQVLILAIVILIAWGILINFMSRHLLDDWQPINSPYGSLEFFTVTDDVK